jgi:hypothetical protein
MRMKTIRLAVMVTAAVALLASVAAAAPAVSITSPAAGASVSRSATPQLHVTGTTGFDTPTPTDREIFLRRDGDGTTCGETFISESDGTDGGNGCSFTFGMLAVAGQDFTELYGNTKDQVNVPLTLDASRNITGMIAVTSVTPNAISFDVKVTLGTQTLTQSVVGEPYTGSWFLDAPIEYPVNIDIPASLDRIDASEVSVAITWKQQVNVAGSTWTELEDPASFISIPSYSASFNRKVELGIDTGAFSGAGVTLSEDLSTFSATIPTPPAGIHSLKARAVQGGATSSVDQRSLTVTA